MSLGWFSNKSPSHALLWHFHPQLLSFELHIFCCFYKPYTGSNSFPPWYVPLKDTPQRTLHQPCLPWLSILAACGQGSKPRKQFTPAFPHIRLCLSRSSRKNHFCFLIYFSLSLPPGSSTESASSDRHLGAPISGIFSLSPHSHRLFSLWWAISTPQAFLTIWKIVFASLGLNDFLIVFQDQSFSLSSQWGLKIGWKQILIQLFPYIGNVH